MPFEAVSTQRLYQKVARQIAGLIHSGELYLGSRLPPERDLSKRLGVSRPTVREAMIALEISGLVEVRTGSGIYVTAPGLEPSFTFDAGPSPFEILGARKLIEPEIAAFAAPLMTSSDLDRLRETLDALGNAADHTTSLDPDRDFHTCIANATGNTALISIVDGLWDKMFGPIFKTLSIRTGLPQNVRMTLADHTAIFERLKARDAEGASRAMRIHLEHVEIILAEHDDPALIGKNPSSSRATG